MTETTPEDRINKEIVISNQVYGISGITDRSFREGYDPTTGIFNKSKTKMREHEYLNYCRLGDPEQIKLTLKDERAIHTRRSSEHTNRIETTIDGSDKVWDMSSSEALINATSYPLHERDKEAKKNVSVKPLLIIFKIGNHKVEETSYKSDKAIGGSEAFASDTDFSNGFGYHLEPGVVKVDKIMLIQEIEADHDETFAKPFKLIDVTHDFARKIE